MFSKSFNSEMENRLVSNTIRLVYHIQSRIQLTYTSLITCYVSFTKMNKDLSFPIKVIFNLQKKLDIPLRNKLERGNKKFLLLYFPVMLELCRLGHILHWYYCFCIIHPPHRCVLSILPTLEIYCNHLGLMILLDVAVWNIICLSYDILN